MDCAFDDDRTIVVAMMDSADLVLYIVKHSLLYNLSPPTGLIVEFSNINTNFYMASLLWIVLLMTIEPLLSPSWTLPFPPNLVLYIVKHS